MSHASDITPPVAWARPGDIALAIETSNPSAIPISPPDARGVLGVALARRTTSDAPHRWQPLHVEPLAPPTPQHDDLMACIERCAREASVAPRHIRALAVSAGPGGFTSVRIAIVCAKMISEATGAACVPVPSAHALGAWRTRRAASNHALDRPFAIALASKHADAFVTCFAPQRHTCLPLGPGSLCNATKLGDLVRKHALGLLIADRFLPPAMLEHATTLGLRIEEPICHPLGVLEAALDHAPVDPAHVVPIYPREPEAVTKWRALRH